MAKKRNEIRIAKLAMAVQLLNGGFDEYGFPRDKKDKAEGKLIKQVETALGKAQRSRPEYRKKMDQSIRPALTVASIVVGHLRRQPAELRDRVTGEVKPGQRDKRNRRYAPYRRNDLVGWVPVAGKDMPDIEKNPGPVGVGHMLDIAFKLCLASGDTIGCVMHWLRVLWRFFVSSSKHVYHSKIVAKICDSVASARVGARRFASACYEYPAPPDSILSAKPSQFVIGKVNLAPADFSTLEGSVAIVTGGGTTRFYNHKDRVLRNFPTTLRWVPSSNFTFVSGSNLYILPSVLNPFGVLNIMAGHRGVTLYPESTVRIIPHTLDTSTSILSWVINSVKYFKCNNHPTTHHLPLEMFEAIVLRYNRADVVSQTAMSELIRRYHKEASDELVTVLFALVGGPKGLRSTTYYTSPVFVNASSSNELPVFDKAYHHDIVPSLLSHPCVLPYMSVCSDLAAVQDRLYCINPVWVEIPRDLREFAREFSQLHKGSLVVPLLFDEVLAAQRTAKTRERIKRAIESDVLISDVPHVEAFVKKEAYPSPKDLRNISAIDPTHNRFGFEFGLAIKDVVLKHFPGYVPGSSPGQVEEKVAYAVSRPLPVKGGFEFGDYIEGDYSRFDGRQTRPLRQLIFGIMRDWIDEGYHKQWDAMIDAHFKTVCKTGLDRGNDKPAVPYKFFGSMLSGAWCTTDANTLLNLFVVFCGLRRTGLSPSAASHHIGLAFGDDSLFRDIINVNSKLKLSDMAVQVAKDLGLKLELENRGSYVSFLSRWFHVGNGAVLGSCPDVARLLDKMHVVVSSFDKEEAAAAKFFGLRQLCGDDTPILSSYLLKWFCFTKTPVPSDNYVELLPYWLQMCERDGTWFSPCTPALRAHVLQMCAEKFKVDVEALVTLETRIIESDSLHDLLERHIDNPVGVVDPKFLDQRDLVQEVPKRVLTEPVDPRGPTEKPVSGEVPPSKIEVSSPDPVVQPTLNGGGSEVKSVRQHKQNKTTNETKLDKGPAPGCTGCKCSEKSI